MARPVPVFAAWQLSDTNLLVAGKSLSSGQGYVYDYNRVRLKGDGRAGKLEFSLTLDHENILGESYLESPEYRGARDADLDLLFKPYCFLNTGGEDESRLYLYRLYVDLPVADDHLTVGLIRVPFSVGRVWTPTDLFNPVNPLAVEKEERLGVSGFVFSHYFGQFGRLQVITTVKEGGGVDKGGFRIKNLTHGIDAGLSGIIGEQLGMLGMELEGNLGESGIELRGEGGWFRLDEPRRRYFRGIVGLEYGFASGLTVIGEYLFNGAGFTEIADYGGFGVDVSGSTSLARHYLALNLAREITPLISSSLAIIRNVNDRSCFAAPSISYSLSDNGEFELGCQIFWGNGGSEFGRLQNLLYGRLNWYF